MNGWQVSATLSETLGLVQQKCSGMCGRANLAELRTEIAFYLTFRKSHQIEIKHIRFVPNLHSANFLVNNIPVYF